MGMANKSYMVYPVDSVPGQAALAKRNLKALDLAKAILKFQYQECLYIATLIGVNEDGFFGSLDEDWSPDQPGAFDEALITIPWVQLMELLGRAPNGATLGFLNGKTQLNPH